MDKRYSLRNDVLVAKWYVLHSKPHKEVILYNCLRDKGFDVFYPCSSIEMEEVRISKWFPYFPGYLFVKIDFAVDCVSEFQWMPYAIGLVHFGERPGQVPDNLINALKQRVRNEISFKDRRMDDLDPEGESLKQVEFYNFCKSIMDERRLAHNRVSDLLVLLEGLNNLPE